MKTVNSEWGAVRGEPNPDLAPILTAYRLPLAVHQQ